MLITEIHNQSWRYLFTGWLGLCLSGCFVPNVQAETKSAAKTTGTATSQVKKTTTSVSKKPAKVTPEQLRALIQERLAKNSYYSPGFLISHSDVEPIFNFLLEKGVTIAADHEELYDSILADNSHLVKLLKTPQGRVFMKKIAGDPTVYERLERLSWTFDGRKLIENLIKAKDGATRLEQLQTPAQVAKVSKQLAADSRTQDFALPTGHIHTADDLLAKLTKVLAGQK